MEGLSLIHIFWLNVFYYGAVSKSTKKNTSAPALLGPTLVFILILSADRLKSLLPVFAYGAHKVIWKGVTLIDIAADGADKALFLVIVFLGLNVGMIVGVCGGSSVRNCAAAGDLGNQHGM